MIRTRHFVLLFAVAIALTAPSPAHAQGKEAATATALFNAGRDLMKAGDYAAAYPKLVASARLDPKVGTLARLAECDEKLGHLVDARGHWQQAVNMAVTDHDDRLAAVQEGLAHIETRVPRVRMSLAAGVAPPPGFSLRVDGLQVGAGALGVALAVEPGSHAITAEAPQRVPWSTSVSTREGGGIVAVVVPELTERPMTVPVTPPVSKVATGGEDVAPAHPRTAVRTVGMVATFAGAAGLTAGFVSGLVAILELSSSRSGCGSAPTGGGVVCNSTSSYDERRTSRTAGDVSTVAFIAGGALAAAGVTIWLMAPKASAAASTVRLAPAIAANASAVLVEGRF